MTSVLKDLPKEHLSSMAVQDGFSCGLFCWKKRLFRNHACTQPQHTHLQVEREFKSWFQAQRFIKDMFMHATTAARKNHAVTVFFAENSLRNSAHNPVVPLRDTSTRVHSGVDADKLIHRRLLQRLR